MNRYFESGLSYAQKGQYRQAAIQFQNAIQINRKFAAAHFQLAQCFVHEGLWPEAYRELSFTLDLEPQNLQAHMGIASLLFSLGQFQEARDRANEILKQEPRHVEALLLLASSNAEIGDLQQAVVEAKQAIEIVPDQVAPYLTLGLLQEKLGKLTDAERSYLRAIELDSKSPTARVALASFYGRQNRWKEAESSFRTSIDLFPGNPIPRSALAQMFVSRGELDSAEQILRDAKSDMPNNPAAYVLLGDFYQQTGKIDKAIAEFASLVRDHAADFDAKRRYVSLLTQNGQLELALSADEELLKSSPGDSDALILKGEILTRLRRAPESEAILQSAIKSDPENVAAHYQLGLAYSEMQRFADAETEWRRVVRVRPAMLEAQEKLANLAYHKGDLELLQQCGDAFLQYAPRSPEGLLIRGTTRLLRKDFEGANRDLQQVIQVAPQNATAVTRMADLSAVEGNSAKAEHYYEQALALDPRAVEALQNLVNLLVRRNEKEQALQRVQSQLIKVPSDGSFHFLLAQILLSDRRLVESDKELDQAISLNPLNMNARLLKAQVQLAMGLPESAVEIYHRLMHDYPRDVRSFLAYGLLEENRGNWEHAAAVYRQALDVQSEEPTAANNLSYILLEHGGDKNYALSLAQIARRAMPESSNTADTLAWAYYQDGIYPSAVELLEKAVKQAPMNAIYRYHLGLAYQKLNRTSQARESLTKALQIDPNFKGADGIRTTLSQMNKD